MGFLENIQSINWVNIATYASILLTLTIFFYQEFSSRVEGKKEVKRIVEEIVDLVIRNHTNKEIGLTEVELGFIVEGFENLKQFKSTLSMSSLLKMIYAKVYTNEHITTEIRKKILRDLDDKISDTESDEFIGEIESKTFGDWTKRNEILSSIICVLLLTFTYKYILIWEYLKDDQLLTFVLIFCILIFVIYWLKPNLSMFLKAISRKQYEKQIETIRMNNFVPKDNNKVIFQKTENEDTEEEIENLKDLKSDANIKKTEVMNESKRSTELTPIKPEKKIKDEKSDVVPPTNFCAEYLSSKFSETDIIQIKIILERRFIFEILIREIYSKVYESDTRLTYTKILSRLYNDEILDSKNFNLARNTMRSASYVIHEGKLNSLNEKFKDLLHLATSFELIILRLLLVLEEDLTPTKINGLKAKRNANE